MPGLNDSPNDTMRNAPPSELSRRDVLRRAAAGAVAVAATAALTGCSQQAEEAMRAPERAGGSVDSLPKRFTQEEMTRRTDVLRAAMKQAGFVVALSPFQHKAVDYANVMLPIAPFTETAGTFVNTEGRAQSFQGVVQPLGETRPAWKVLRVLGKPDSRETARTDLGAFVDLSWPGIQVRRWDGAGGRVIDIAVKDLAARGILIRSPSSRGVAEEAPGAYKDVSEVVAVAEAAGLAKTVADRKSTR